MLDKWEGGAGLSARRVGSRNKLRSEMAALEDSIGSTMEDSIGSTMDYDAEVAYISMTNPVCSRKKPVNDIPSNNSDDEFDFYWAPPAQKSTNTAILTTTASASSTTSFSSITLQSFSNQSHESPGRWRNPLLLSKLNLTHPVKAGIHTSPEKKVFVSTDGNMPFTPSSLDIAPHFSASTETPRMPASQLCRMRPVLDTTPPSLCPRHKLWAGEHLYSMLVVYGSSGCGRTHLVDTLVHSNPLVFSKVLASTTRKRRAEELNGVDLNFISHREMSRSISKGDFMEYTTIHKKRNGSTPLCSQKTSHNQGSSPPSVRDETGMDKGTAQTISTWKTSVFKEDSFVAGRDMLGTTYQALTDAIQQGKPCVIVNVSSRGAHQLQSSRVQGSYVEVQNVHSNKYRPPCEGGGPQPDHIISTASLEEAYSELYQYAFQLVSDLNEPTTSQLVSDLNKPTTSHYQTTKAEWDALPTIVFDHSKSVPYKFNTEVTFSELLVHFQSFRLKKQLNQAKAEESNPKLFIYSKLSKNLQEEKLIMLAITYCSLNKDGLHLRMLQTIYSKLTGNSMNCPRYSTHWQEIGFSGLDPADDLQDVGLLGPAQLIFFLGNIHTAPICREIFQHCQLRDSQTMPFCILSFTFSKFSLDTLQGGFLNKTCNKKEQVFVVTNNFYMAAFYYYYRTWRSSRKAVLELSLLQYQCQDYCKAHTQQILREFEEIVSARQPQHTLLPTKQAFTSLDEMTPL